jgi:hypothetical protein
MYFKLKRMAIVILILLTTVFCNACNLSNNVIIYNGNGNTSGSVPTDTTLYNFLDPVTVVDNTGKLLKPNYAFAGWSKKVSGKGKTYKAGETFLMGWWGDVTLYAVWDDGNQCVFKNCFPEIRGCLQEEECSNWLSCITECGDDKFQCPTYCGLFYESPKTEQLQICALSSDCPVVDFSSFDECTVPTVSEEAPFLDLSGISDADGTWWLSASSGEDHLFDFDCQQFVFEGQDPKLLNVNFAVTLSQDDIEIHVGTEGTFEQIEDGSIIAEYGSYAAYLENWYIVHKSDNTLLIHVCFTTDIDSKDYGTLVLSRIPLESLTTSEYDDLDAAVNKYFGTGIDQLFPVKNKGCAY